MTRPWWSKKWGNDKKCSISYTRLRPGKNNKGIYYTTTLKCNHSFCTFPLVKWIKNCPRPKEPTCPICREKFSLQDLIRT